MNDKSDILTTRKRLLSMDQVCEKLGCSKWTIYRLINKREIPFVQLGQRLYRFDDDLVDKWISDRATGTVHDIQ